MKLKTGDSVVVLAGKYKGATGEITAVYPKANKVLIAGVNIVKKHQKPTNKDQKGGIIDKEMPIHISNVAIVCGKCGPTRIGYKVDGGSKQRVCRKCGGDL